MSFHPFQNLALCTKMSWKDKQLIPAGAVLDGDTAYLFFDKGERGYENPSCRFYGIDAPETSGAHSALWRDDPLAGEIAKTAKARVQALIEGKEVFCRSMDRDKYGRRLDLIWITKEDADSEDPARSLNQLLINEGLAKRYMDTQNILKDKVA